MEVYRICLAKWANELVASGNPARWNARGQFVIYTASSRALACLENLVHRSGEGLSLRFKIMVIQVPDHLPIDIIAPESLPSDWRNFLQYPVCQELGAAWLQSQSSVILQVPSAIVPQEKNYLLNPAHPDFNQVVLHAIEDFWFDPRLKD